MAWSTDLVCSNQKATLIACSISVGVLITCWEVLREPCKNAGIHGKCSSTSALITVHGQPDFTMVSKALSWKMASKESKVSDPLLIFANSSCSVLHVPAATALTNWVMWEQDTDRYLSLPCTLATFPFAACAKALLASIWACFLPASLATSKHMLSLSLSSLQPMLRTMCPLLWESKQLMSWPHLLLGCTRTWEARICCFHTRPASSSKASILLHFVLTGRDLSSLMAVTLAFNTGFMARQCLKVKEASLVLV